MSDLHNNLVDDDREIEGAENQEAVEQTESHDGDVEIVAAGVLERVDHGKRQIVFDRPLVKFVEYDVRNALEKWIGAKIA